VEEGESDVRTVLVFDGLSETDGLSRAVDSGTRIHYTARTVQYPHTRRKKRKHIDQTTLRFDD